MGVSRSVPSMSSHSILVDYEKPLLHEQELENSKEVTGARQEQDGASFLRTCFNGLNALIGVGLLSVPYALSTGGWLGLPLLFIIAMVCFYTGILLQRCMSTDPSIRSYPDIGELAFGHKGRLFVSVFMYIELYLVAIGFLILEGDNLDKLFPDTSISIGTLSIAGKQLFIILVALVILPTTWLRSLGVLAYVSATGVLASFIVALSVFWAGEVDGVGFRERGRLINLSGLPTAVGLYTFCYCGHAIFPTLRNSMKDKAKFSKVLVVCFVICNAIYGLTAVFGYLMYGEDLKSQVTLNLPVGKLSSKVAIYTTIFNPFSKYALTVAPVATAIEERFLALNKIYSTLSVRTLLLLSTVVIALVIPFFGQLMAFIGSLLSITVSVLLPCICYIKIFKKPQIPKVERVLIWVIVVLGCLIAITGTYSSVRQIVDKF
ncbi:amino acid transporter AVT1I-like isoform X1 [Typha angustifolia]|uniref:amino acid transporter AVT1I-like isoform X1 n=2 Tax=Typha angustifolia TaxID=59011 RepID=UPI003C2F3807